MELLLVMTMMMTWVEQLEEVGGGMEVTTAADITVDDLVMSVATWWRLLQLHPTTSRGSLPSVEETFIYQHLKKRSSNGLCTVLMTLLARCCMLDQRWTLAQDGLKQRRPAWTEITQTQACINILLKGAQHTWRLKMLAI